MEKPTFEGKCLCGAVTVKVVAKNNEMTVCHCGMCRAWSGGPAFSVDAAEGTKIIGEANVERFKSSQWAERGFCRVCGTHLFYHLKDGGFYNFPVGLLKGTENLKFTTQIFIDKKPHNYSFAEVTENMTEQQVYDKYGPPSV